MVGSINGKRVRRTTSCQSCRERRKACDGVIPCKSCTRRGLGAECRWGDDRDQESMPAPITPRNFPQTPTYNNSTTVNAAVAASPGFRTSAVGTPHFFSEPQSNASSPAVYSQPSDLASTLAQADLNTTAETTPSNLMVSEAEIDLPHNSLTSRRARHLIGVFRQHASFGGLLLLDYDALYACLSDGCDVAVDRKSASRDVMALLLFVCAAALHGLPPTLSISLGLASHFEETNEVALMWTDEALLLLEASDIHIRPTLAAIQAIVVFQYNLSHRGRTSLMVAQYNTVIRAARMLGLDRLGSLEDDERIWREADQTHSSLDEESQRDAAAQLPSHSSADWAAQTLRGRDKWSREIGRSLWTLVTNRDWGASRQMGCYLIHPGSFTTAPPRMRLKCGFGVQGGNEDETLDPWALLMPTSDIIRRFHDMCAEAAASSLTGRVSYDLILGLDRELESLAKRRPLWLQPELHPTMHGAEDVIVLVDARGVEMKSPFMGSILSTGIWHRFLSIHRPFLSLGLSRPEKYGLSARRAFSKAMLFLQVSRQNSQEGMLVVQQSVILARLLQASLVIITYLLLGGSGSMAMQEGVCDPGWLDPMRIHAHLSYVIATFHATARPSRKRRRVDKTAAALDNTGSHFTYEGVAERLEFLVAACARLTSNERHLYWSEPDSTRGNTRGGQDLMSGGNNNTQRGSALSTVAGLSATQANNIDTHLYLLGDASVLPPTVAPLKHAHPGSGNANNSSTAASSSGISASMGGTDAALVASLSTVDDNLWDELSRMLQQPTSTLRVPLSSPF